jgi:uncharacterized Zn-finger protein
MADAGLSAVESTDKPVRERAVVELAAAELQSQGVVFCPNPKMPLWSNHPRVYIDVASTGVGKCPYCGTEYRLKAGETARGH